MTLPPLLDYFYIFFTIERYNIFYLPPPTPHPHLASAPILYRSTIQDGGIENDLLSSVPLQNNACTAGYILMLRILWKL